jgi:hypothetical protein
MEAIKKVTLCPACGGCPEVAVYDNEVRIGEKENLVRLKKAEWNEIVRKVKTGELKEV